MLFLVQILISKIARETEPSVEKHIMKDFKTQTLSSGNKAQYDIHLKMNSDGEFQLDTTVKTTNISEDPWKELVFYFIPNIFTKDTSEHSDIFLEEPATVEINSITVEDRPVEFSLDKDTLTIPLGDSIQTDDRVKVDFSYHFTLPVGGLRFTKMNHNYYLAQFYPMIATYRNNKWNKEEYTFSHTGFNDFTVSYDIPDGYTFVSTNQDEDYPSPNSDSFDINNVKEVFRTILKEPFVIEKKNENINIRVFGFEENEDLYKEIIEVAYDSLCYFQKVIGPHPWKEILCR